MKKFNINEQNKCLPIIIGIEILIMLVLIVLLVDKLGDNLRMILDPYSAQK